MITECALLTKLLFIPQVKKSRLKTMCPCMALTLVINPAAWQLCARSAYPYVNQFVISKCLHSLSLAAKQLIMSYCIRWHPWGLSQHHCYCNVPLTELVYCKQVLQLSTALQAHGNSALHFMLSQIISLMLAKSHVNSSCCNTNLEYADAGQSKRLDTASWGEQRGAKVWHSQRRGGAGGTR